MYVEEFKQNDLDRDHFLVLALEAALMLKWTISYVNESGFIATTRLSWKSWKERISIRVENGTADIKSECLGAQFYDWDKNQDNVNALIAAIRSFKRRLTEEEIENRLAVLREQFSANEDNVSDNPHVVTEGTDASLVGRFSLGRGYFITAALIASNVLIFILMMIKGVHFLQPEGQELLRWGANFRPMTLEDQYWRLLTSCFLHFGVFHLLINMFALLYIGLILEPHLGKSRFLAAYLFCGITGSVASIWWNDMTISAGASGAIFGMYGVFLVLLTTNLLPDTVKKRLLASTFLFVLYNIVYGLTTENNVDNAAHIGGLLCGLIIGFAYFPSLKKAGFPSLKYATIGLLTALLLWFSTSVCRSLPNDFGKYEAAMKRVFAMEAMALEIFSLPKGTPDEVYLKEIRERGIYYWNENINVINSFKNLELPQPIRERNSRLKKYFEIRAESYELMYKGIEEGTDKYNFKIGEYNRKIEYILKELRGNSK